MPTYHPNEWPLKMCKVKEAWELSLPDHGQGKAKGEGIIIFHPDTGYTFHPEIIKGGRYLTSFPISKNFFGVYAPYLRAEDILSGLHASHGTSTASVMFSDEGHPSQNPVNTNYPYYTVPIDQFVTGFAPLASVAPQRVTDLVLLHSVHSMYGRPVNTYATLANSLLHCVSLNHQAIGVISISLGGLRKQANLDSALQECRRQGIIICAAAGQAVRNWELIGPTFPGNSPHTICVAGCTKTYDKPNEGLYSEEVDITAPGWGVAKASTSGNEPTIKTPHPARNYRLDLDGEGTSYATAMTAAACALWLAFHNRTKLIETYGKPFLHDVFKHCLINSCDKRGGSWPRNRGYGVLDVQALLNYSLPSVATVENSARSSSWTESKWGNSSNWGRI